jgi:hypothetical protein
MLRTNEQDEADENADGYHELRERSVVHSSPMPKLAS